MGLRVKQFRYASDNLAYLVHGDVSAMAIDGGAVNAIISFVEVNRLELKYITNTHSHMDHTVGDRELLERSGAFYIGNNVFSNNDTIELDGEKINVYHTPGHTLDSVSFHFENMLISGDTLFNGKAGRCFSGDLMGFYKSIKMIMGLPGETCIYSGHDYVEEYMAFARKIEPDNKYIDTYLKNYDPGHVVSTLNDEFHVNPHLRFNDDKMIMILKERGLPVETEYDRWLSVMSLE